MSIVNVPHIISYLYLLPWVETHYKKRKREANIYFSMVLNFILSWRTRVKNFILLIDRHARRHEISTKQSMSEDTVLDTPLRAMKQGAKLGFPAVKLLGCSPLPLPCPPQPCPLLPPLPLLPCLPLPPCCMPPILHTPRSD